MHTDCENCLLTQAQKMLIKHNIPKNIAKKIMNGYNLFIAENRNNGTLTPEAACYLHRLLKKEAKINDLYKKEKDEYNQLMLSLEGDIREKIENSPNPFQTALRYALAGNIIDFGPPEPFDVFKTLAAAASKIPAIDHSEILYQELKRASTVLYLGDNAGEIVLDKIFISVINHPNLWFATRGAPVINDVTTKDAENVGMTNVAKIISNGYDAPSTLVKHCSPEFKKLFDKADIIISKGQGNLEGLINNKEKKIFFLFMVKCDVIGELIGIPKSNSVVFFNSPKIPKSTM
ncbi:MAG: ARMT1-like domain-containing protein [Mariniphaga sp.]|nr:ARMT1-like domain-containing protein [Mariniphaga sp.]MDD4424982.1 ARMT1-like domain-containing protein [Mariniphaga sp.]